MSDEKDSMDNINRLLEHLDNGSLAARLVREYLEGQQHDPASGVKAALVERLEQIRKKLDGPTD